MFGRNRNRNRNTTSAPNVTAEMSWQESAHLIKIDWARRGAEMADRNHWSGVGK